MTQVHKPMMQPVKRRGNTLYMTLPRKALDRLGWNLHDVLHCEVVDKSLVMTRVDLPKIGILRKGSPTPGQ